MTAFTGLSSNSWMSSSGTTAWNTSYDYDPNGNLLALTRNDAAGSLMDNLSYTYNTNSGRLLSNRLVNVDDPVNGGVGDIYDLHEYEYDAIGNLIKDESEEIDSIIWDAYGKVHKILRTDTSSRPELEFRYDALGNRVMKIAKHGVNQEDWTYSIYSRDAIGNVIAVYERKWTSTTALTSPDADLVIQIPSSPSLGTGLIGIKVNGIYLTNGPVLTEKTAALTATALANAINAYETESFDFTAEVDGDIVFLFTEEEYTEPLNFEIINTDVDFISSEYFDFIAPRIRGFKPHSGSFTQVPLIETVSLQELHLYGSSRLGIKTPYLQVDKQQIKSAYVNNYGDSLYLSYLDSRVLPLSNPTNGPFFEYEKGLKQYELSNHLRNVLVVVDDKKVSQEGNMGTVGHYTASLLNVQDYFPGGWAIPGRKYSNANKYRYRFQGQEMDDEIGAEGGHAFFAFRISNTQTNRFYSVDPLAAKYPFYSTYTFSGNRLIDAVELEGLEPKRAGSAEGGSVTIQPPAIDIETFNDDRVEEWIWHSGTCISGTQTTAGWYTPGAYRRVLIDISYQAMQDEDNQWKYYTESITPSDFGFEKSTVFTENALVQLGTSAQNSYTFIPEIPVMGSEGGGITVKNPNYIPWVPATGRIEYVPFVEMVFMPAGLPFRVSSPVLRFGLETINPLGGMGVGPRMGWRVGDDITNLTAKGNVPSWSAVRQRFWKNEAFYNSASYSPSNILRMRKGLAPQLRNPQTGGLESMELHHHLTPQRDGGLFDFIIVTPQQHKTIDPFRK